MIRTHFFKLLFKMLDELFNDTFGIRWLISDQTAYTLNAGTANYTEHNRTLFFSMFSGHTQVAYEKLYMHLYTIFMWQDTVCFTSFCGTWYTVRLALLIHVPAVFISSTVWWSCIILETVGQSNDAKILTLHIDHCDLHIMVKSLFFLSSTLFYSYALCCRQF